VPGQKGLDQWIYLNVGRIAQQLPYPVLPVYVQQSPDPNRSGPPVQQTVQLDLSEGPHLGYALQWFAFAIILLVGYPFFVRRQETTKHA
jgi:surfeit locus 1 family protein